MRISVFVRTAFLLLAIASPLLVRAQFQPPTAEELKMTADPKAPGAAAVFLNIEEVANDPLHFQSLHVRIKILQEKGKELATVELPYLKGDTKITEIQARTIHSDGTVIPMTGKPEDLLISKSEDRQYGRKVFTLPSVEVGSILEYYYQLHYDQNSFMSPYWEIQRPYYVHKAHFTFTPYGDFMPGGQNGGGQSGDSLLHLLVDEHGDRVNTLVWWPVLPPGVTVKTESTGRYTVDISDVPPMPDEEWMPPVQNFRYKVLFYYKSASNVDDFWVAELKRWSKDLDRFAETAKSIHEAVDGLIAPGDADLEKARKLYKAVQALDNTDFSRRKGEAELKQLKLKVAKRAEDTWSQKSGSSEDIALLYLAMVRAAGLNAKAMKVVDRQKGIFDSSYLSVSQLNATIVILDVGGKEIVLDPGQKMCPFQTAHWRHSNAGGFLQGSDGRTPKTSAAQAYTDNKLARSGDIVLDGRAAVTGTLRFSMTGQEALYWRQLTLGYDEDEVKKQFDRWIATMVPDGVEAHIDHFQGLDDPDVILVAAIKAQGTLGMTTSKRVLLPGFFFETRGHHPFVGQEKRQEPVDMHYGEVVSDQVAYHLPPGLAVEGAPQDAKISWPEHAMLVTKTVSAPGQIVIARTLALAFTFAMPNEYSDLRGFYQKVAAADRQQVVLTASPAAKGN